MGRKVCYDKGKALNKTAADSPWFCLRERQKSMRDRKMSELKKGKEDLYGTEQQDR